MPCVLSINHNVANDLCGIFRQAPLFTRTGRFCCQRIVGLAFGTTDDNSWRPPYGKGSVQLFINHDPDEHYLTFSGQFVDQLQRIVLFDAVINNADRKSGHVLLDHHGTGFGQSTTAFVFTASTNCAVSSGSLPEMTFPKRWSQICSN